MVWSWSHSNEALDNAYNNLLDIADKANSGNIKSVEFLVVCYAENKTDFNRKGWEKTYKKHLREAYRGSKSWGFNGIAEEIWSQACDIALCDNGGHNCYLCSHGCHTVPFERVATGRDCVRSESVDWESMR